jgi:rhomboid protease GluP
VKSYPASMILLGLLFVCFAVELASGAMGSDSSLLRLGAIPDSGGLHGQYWRLFTYSLLHSGYLHLVMNSALLWWTGRIVERRVGGVSMISIYVSSVLSGGLLLAWWKSLHPTLTVSLGASAGVFGILAASLVLLYRPAAYGFGQHSRIRGSLWLMLGAGIAISFLPGVSFVGHLGGLASGAILGFFVPVLTAKESRSLDDPNQPAA